jgi:hypothetical protein
MGQSSYVVKYTQGALSNPVLSNINPKYTINSPTNSYDPMIAQALFPTRSIVVQIAYRGGTGDVVSNDPGANGFGERIATVSMNIEAAIPIVLQWDTENSDVVGPGGFPTATSLWNGFYSGTLPVELSSFTSLVHKNDVMLNWSTSSEVNNSGFEIERKYNTENSDWSKVAFINGGGNSDESRSYSYKDNGLKTGKYNYRLKQIDFNGNFEYFNLENEIVIGVPTQFELVQNYPNPFNPSTTIGFSLPNDSKVSLKIYDISGKLVSTLLNNEFKTADYYKVSFNGSNLSSGTYFYSVQTDRNNETKKMVLIK